MKNVLFIFILLFSIKGMAFEEFKINHDVFHCGEEVKFVFEVEKSLGLYHVDAEGISFKDTGFEESVNTLAKELGEVAPIRADFFREIADPQNSKIQYRKKVQILRSSPHSNIIQPQGCIVEPISVTSFDEGNNYSAVINKTLFDLLSAEGKVYLLLTMSLDIEQILFQNFWSNKNIDLIQSREFLACWYNYTCRPKSVADFHKLSRQKIYNFQFFEQDHIIIPMGDKFNTIEFSLQTGLITKAEFPSTGFYNISNALQSNYVFRGNKYLYLRPLIGARVSFNHEGKVNCVPKINNISIVGINYGKEININKPCWNKKERITSGELESAAYLAPEIIYNLAASDSSGNVINAKQGANFVLYDSEALNWISDVAGTIVLSNQKIKVKGMMKFYPSGKIQCFSPGPGMILNIPSDENLIDANLYCFSEDGNFLKSYKTHYFDAIEIIH
ncbi:MAG: hypothetical protein K2Q18_14960 [Bdellovibrionales bacterium]|nr:hypothetical protein [Bdellovibrionales bacterium]